MTNPFDYSSRDFASLRADMQAIAQGLLPEWTNITNPTDFGAVLLDLFAYAGDIANYYIDRVANEALLSTAQRRQTVLNIAAMFNYTPIGTTPATGSLKFTLANGTPTTTIPAGTKVSTTPTAGVAPIIYETDNDLVISGSNAATPVNIGANGTITATQGVTISNEVLTSNADGTLGATYSLYNPDVIAGSIVVTVTDLSGDYIWREVSNLLETTSIEQVYSTSIDENNVTTIQFGDNVFGHAPAKGVTISATYRIGGGTVGNVAVGTVVELVSPIVGVQSVTNPGAFAGGADPETIESMRVNIPKSLSALNRAVTLSDYEALALQVPGIAKASATSTTAVSVLLRLAPVGGSVTNPSTTGPYTAPGTQKYAVDQYLSDKKMVNVTVSYGDPVWDAINIAASVTVLDGYYQPTVQSGISAAIGQLLSFDNVDFGQLITISQVYHTIQSVPGVDYATLTTLVEANAATPSGVQNITCSVNAIPYLNVLSLSMSGGVQ